MIKFIRDLVHALTSSEEYELQVKWYDEQIDHALKNKDYNRANKLERERECVSHCLL